MFNWFKKKPDPTAVVKTPEETIRKTLERFARIAAADFSGDPNAPAQWVVDKNEYTKHVKGPVYVAVGAVARKVAMQVPRVRRRVLDKGTAKLEDVPHTHPLVQLLEEVNPHPSFVPFDLWFLTVAWRLVTGDSYWWKLRNGLSVPAEIWPIPSQWVHAVPSPTRYIDSYRVDRFFGADGKAEIIPVEDMVHTRENSFDWSGNGRFYGMPPLTAASEMVDVDEQIKKRLFYEFKNYSKPGLHFHTDEHMSPDQLDEAIVDIMAQHSFSQQQGRPLITHSGFKASDFSASMKEIDYQQSLETVFDYVLSIFGVPKAVVGLVADANRSNMESALLTFAENTVNPLLVNLGQHLTVQLARDFGDDLVVEFDMVNVKDREQIRKDFETGFKAAALTPNDVREEFLGMGPFPFGGDRPIMPGVAFEAEFGNEKPEPKPDPVLPAQGELPPNMMQPNGTPATKQPQQNDQQKRHSPIPRTRHRSRATVGQWQQLYDVQEKAMRSAAAESLSHSKQRVLGRFRLLSGLPEVSKRSTTEGLVVIEKRLSPGSSNMIAPVGELDVELGAPILAEIKRGMLRGALFELKFAGVTKQFEPLFESALSAGFFEEIPPDLAAAIDDQLRESFDFEFWKNNVSDNTRKGIEKLLSQAVREGWTLNEMENALIEDSQGLFDRNRAERIARTETTGALNGGAYQADIQLLGDGTFSGREWMSIIDERTRGAEPEDRFDHLTMDGEIAKGTEPFVVSGEPARYPGDPKLSAGNRCNCRCTTAPVL